MVLTPGARRASRIVGAIALCCLAGWPQAAGGGQSKTAPGPVQARPAQGQPPDFPRMLRLQAETDLAWRKASEGYMRMEKISYRSRAGGLDIPAFVFQPLQEGTTGTRPALVWVHENIRGHVYEHYIPFVREAVARGYVVIAPEYRGSIGYGQACYGSLDSAPTEVDDVVTAVSGLPT